jgi:hypothetical protein
MEVDPDAPKSMTEPTYYSSLDAMSPQNPLANVTWSVDLKDFLDFVRAQDLQHRAHRCISVLLHPRTCYKPYPAVWITCHFPKHRAARTACQRRLRKPSQGLTRGTLRLDIPFVACCRLQMHTITFHTSPAFESPNFCISICEQFPQLLWPVYRRVSSVGSGSSSSSKQPFVAMDSASYFNMPGVSGPGNPGNVHGLDPNFM